VVTVVLVRPIYPRNIGLVSRAIVNMGFSNLVLIAPQCELDFEARLGAATGQEPLSNARVYESWEGFNQEHTKGVRLAFSTKDGQSRIVLPLMDELNRFKEQPHLILDKQFYFVFGPEDWGLSNLDISYCHMSVAIPTYGSNPSLNLSHAVLLALYSFRLVFGGTITDIRQRTKDSDFNTDSEWFPDTSLTKFLISLGFDLRGRRVSAYSILKQYFLRALPTNKEKRILASVFEQAARKLTVYNEMRSQIKGNTEIEKHSEGK